MRKGQSEMLALVVAIGAAAAVSFWLYQRYHSKQLAAVRTSVQNTVASISPFLLAS